MLASSFRNLVYRAVGTVAAGLMVATLAVAQTPTAAIDQFLANPSQVATQYPNGGAQLISLIRDVATSHPEALQNIIGLLAGASADQQSAIGSGLGQAYKIVITTDQNYATQIAAAIANSNSDGAKTAYASVVGDVLIGSTGSAGVGGAAGGGSGGPTGSGGVFGGTNTGTGPAGTQAIQTSSQNFFTGTGVGGATSAGTASSTSSGSVSRR